MENLVRMTDLRVSQVKTDKPDSYCAKKYYPCRTDEMKALIGLRTLMKYSVIKKKHTCYTGEVMGRIVC